MPWLPPLMVASYHGLVTLSFHIMFFSDAGRYSSMQAMSFTPEIILQVKILLPESCQPEGA